jgi:hypothetical protein
MALLTVVKLTNYLILTTHVQNSGLPR